MTELSDRDIEALLRKYQPLDGPPVARVQARVWPWAMAAAALLVISIGLHVRVAPATRPQAFAVDGETAPTPEPLAMSNRAVAEWLEHARIVEERRAERSRELALEDAWR